MLHLKNMFQGIKRNFEMNPRKVFSTAGSHNSLRGIHCSTRNVREWDSIHCNSNRCLLLILVPRSLTELDAASLPGKTHPHDFVISKHIFIVARGILPAYDSDTAFRLKLAAASNVL